IDLLNLHEIIAMIFMWLNPKDLYSALLAHRCFCLHKYEILEYKDSRITTLLTNDSDGGTTIETRNIDGRLLCVKKYHIDMCLKSETYYLKHVKSTTYSCNGNIESDVSVKSTHMSHNCKPLRTAIT